MAAAGAQAFCSGVRFGFAGLASGRGDGTGRGGVRGRRTLRQQGIVSVRASASTLEEVEFEEGDDVRTRWAGDDPLARLVSSVISIKPVFKLMKIGAKSVMVRTAERSGIPWQQMVDDLRASEVYAEKDLVENVGISYPDYYTREFHGYEDGNLCWEAAFEVEPATMVMTKRAFPKIKSAKEAGKTLRNRWLQKVESHHTKFSRGLQAAAVLDVGCSTGNSTRCLRDRFPGAQVTGLDLSPYFLAVAQYIEKQEATNSSSRDRHIQYVHANAEETGLPSASFDIISYSFVLHELPGSVLVNILKEAHRLLRPGGTISFVEQSPKSKVIQRLPPALFMMMKATEPWLDEFHMLNLEDELERNGFSNVSSVLTDPRHFTLTATAI